MNSLVSTHYENHRGRLAVLLGRFVLACVAIQAAGLASYSAEALEPVPMLPTAEAEPLPDSLRRNVPASVDELRAIQSRVRSLYSKLRAVTVGVRRGPAQGTGVIVSRQGYVLTAAHVSGPPGSEVTVILPDGTLLDAKSLGRETYIDAGLIKILDEGEWPTAPLGSVRDLEPGDWVIGVGHPGGYQEDRPSVPRLGRIIGKQDWVLRTDVALIGGDSGGPLFDLHGHVVGIHSRIGPDPNLNFHVPINVFRDNWHWLAAGEQRPVGDARAGDALLGVNGEDDGRGCRVIRVFGGSPAADGGLRPGDLILRVDERFILGIDDLKASVRHYDPGDVIDVTLLRERERLVLPVRLGERSAQEEQSE